MVMIMTPMFGKYYRYNYLFNQLVNDFKGLNGIFKWSIVFLNGGFK